MVKRTALLVATPLLWAANAYAVQAPAEDEGGGFPLAIVFALIAVFISVGVVIMGASQNKKKKD